MDSFDNGAAENSSGPERNNQQFGSLLQQAWDSIERARFNIAATVGAIEELERNLTDFEKRRSRNTDTEKTVGELEPSIEEQSTVEHGIESIPDASTDDLSRQGIEQDKEGDRGLSEIPEEDSSYDNAAPKDRNIKNLGTSKKQDFGLDL